MYRHLLGDCFLLTIRAAGQKPSFILVDCGILQNVEGDKERMGAIAANIRETTGGFIDLLIITHQHHDHISGFAHAKDILLDPDKMKYGAVWMAWTEDPKDSQANALRETFSNRKLAMAGVANALAAQGQDNLLDELTRDLQNFIGPIEPAAAGLSAAPQGRLTGDRIMVKRVADADRVLRVDVPAEAGDHAVAISGRLAWRNQGDAAGAVSAAATGCVGSAGVKEIAVAVQVTAKPVVAADETGRSDTVDVHGAFTAGDGAAAIGLHILVARVEGEDDAIGEREA